jgi:hypothetical protein
VVGAVGLAAIAEADAHADKLGADVGDEAGAEKRAAVAEAKAHANAVPDGEDEAVAVEIDAAAKQRRRPRGLRPPLPP